MTTLLDNLGGRPARKVVKLKTICGRSLLDPKAMSKLDNSREGIRHALPNFTFNPFSPENLPADFEAPYRVNWETISFCNMHCGFCFADFDHAQQDESVVSAIGLEKAASNLTTDEAQALIYQAAALGVKQFLFGGGDPFIRSDMPALIEYAHSLGLEVLVDTNGLILGKNQKLFDKVSPFIHQLGISLDGASAEAHDNFRESPGSFNKVMRLLQMAAPIDSLRVKINTIVTAENAGDVGEIPSILAGKKVERLSLDQFIPLRAGDTNRDQYLISDEAYTEAVKEVQQAVTEAGIPMTVGGGLKKSKAQTVFMIGPQGVPYTAQGDQKHYVLGSVRDVPLHELITAGDLDLEKMNGQRYGGDQYYKK